MKIINLLNKIYNEEEVPDKIKFNEVIFEYNKDRKEYMHKINDFHSETLLFEVMCCHYTSEILETEVKLIEDEIDIQEIEELNFKNEYTGEKLKTTIEQQNTILKWAKQLDKKLKEFRDERDIKHW